MSIRLMLAVVALLASFAGGFTVSDWRRDAIELKKSQTAAREFHRLLERTYESGMQLSKTVERQRFVTNTIKETIHVYLPADVVERECPRLPSGFRVLHDAASEGADPAATSGGNAPGPTPQEVAGTIAENYGAFHICSARLDTLQAYVRDVVRPDGVAQDGIGQ